MSDKRWEPAFLTTAPKSPRLPRFSDRLQSNERAPVTANYPTTMWPKIQRRCALQRQFRKAQELIKRVVNSLNRSNLTSSNQFLADRSGYLSLMRMWRKSWASREIVSECSSSLARNCVSVSQHAPMKRAKRSKERKLRWETTKDYPLGRGSITPIMTSSAAAPSTAHANLRGENEPKMRGPRNNDREGSSTACHLGQRKS